MNKWKNKSKNFLSVDLIYNSLEVSKFINIITISGKKNIARNIVYKAFDYIKNKFKKNPILVFSRAIDNVAPMIEIKNLKVAGNAYIIPLEIKSFRRISLSMRWIKNFSKLRTEKYMYLRLAHELFDAFLGKGESFKKKCDIHRAAELNKIHFRY